jgi:hypothetical protein
MSQLGQTQKYGCSIMRSALHFNNGHRQTGTVGPVGAAINGSPQHLSALLANRLRLARGRFGPG